MSFNPQDGYSDEDFLEAPVRRSKPRRHRIELTSRGVIAAVGEMLAEQRREIRALQDRIEVLEREPSPGPRLRAVGE